MGPNKELEIADKQFQQVLQINIRISRVIDMSVMQEAVDHYKYLLTLNDKRVENWLLLKDPTPSIYIAVAYLAFCFAAPRVLFKLTLSGLPLVS